MPYKDKNVRVAKHKEWSHNHYEATKETTKIRIKAQKVKNKKIWDAFKATLKCAVCGENHPAVLDFHHVNPEDKEYSISTLVSNKSFTKAMKEVEKCIVLCANHHRIVHYDERKNPAL